MRGSLLTSKWPHVVLCVQNVIIGIIYYVTYNIYDVIVYYAGGYLLVRLWQIIPQKSPIILFFYSQILSPLLTLGACARITVVVLSVCVCVCYRASCYIPRLYVENRVPLGFLCCSPRMHRVDFIENALFKSSGEIC